MLASTRSMARQRNSISPDFIYIGAGKCGSTSLVNYLNQHSDIFMCPKKETFFFLPDHVRQNHKRFGAVSALDDYLDLFHDAPPDACIGEISTNYYAYPESAQLIQSQFPNVKLIAILRNPADRAFSAYQMFVRAGHEKTPFKDLIHSNGKYIQRGFYYRQLMPFFEVFDPAQIRIFLYDDLCKSPATLMREIFSFLEVDHSFIPDMTNRGRVGGLPKNSTLNRILTQKNWLRTIAANGLKLVVPLKTRQKLRSALIKTNIQIVSLDPESRRQLAERYREDILGLQELIERDLSAWLP